MSFLSLPCPLSFTLNFLVNITQNKLVQKNSNKDHNQLYYTILMSSPRSALNTGAGKHCKHPHANNTCANTNTHKLLQSITATREVKPCNKHVMVWQLPASARHEALYLLYTETLESSRPVYIVRMKHLQIECNFLDRVARMSILIMHIYPNVCARVINVPVLHHLPASLLYRPPGQPYLALIYYICLKTVKSDFYRKQYIMQVTWQLNINSF